MASKIYYITMYLFIASDYNMFQNYFASIALKIKKYRILNDVILQII